MREGEGGVEEWKEQRKGEKGRKLKLYNTQHAHILTST
jgi:hypothetical protein